MLFNSSNLRLASIPLLVLLHVAALGLVFWLPEGVWPRTLVGGRLRIALGLGLMHGEIAVIAAWAAWSRMTLVLRIPLVIVGSLTAGFALLPAMTYPFAFPDLPIARVVPTLSDTVLHAALIMGMCLAARAFGIEWRNVTSGKIPAHRQGQFHLWELLALMAALALLLGALRGLWPKDAEFSLASIRVDTVIFSGVSLVGNLLIANTVLTIYWTPRGSLWNLAITLGITAIITLLEWAAVSILDLRRSLFMLVWMNGCYLGWLLMSLGLMRLAGYRLERVRFPKWTRRKGGLIFRPPFRR